MPAAFVTSSSYTAGADATSHTCSFTVSSGTTGLLIFTTYGNTNEDVLSSLTADGTTLTALGTNQGAGGRGDGATYYVVAPTVKAGYNVVLNLTTARRAIIHVMHLSGVHQTTAPTTLTGTLDSTGANHNVVIPTANGAFCGLWVNRAVGGAYTAGANTTETFDGAVGNNSVDRTFCGYGLASGTSLTLSCSDASGAGGGTGNTRGVSWLEAPAGGASNAPRSMFYHLQGMR